MRYFKRKYFPRRRYQIPFKWIFLIIIIGILYLLLKFVFLFQKTKKIDLFFPQTIKKEVA